MQSIIFLATLALAQKISEKKCEGMSVNGFPFISQENGNISKSWELFLIIPVKPALTVNKGHIWAELAMLIR